MLNKAMRIFVEPKQAHMNNSRLSQKKVTVLLGLTDTCTAWHTVKVTKPFCSALVRHPWKAVSHFPALHFNNKSRNKSWEEQEQSKIYQTWPRRKGWKIWGCFPKEKWGGLQNEVGKGSQREEEYPVLDAFGDQDESHRQTEMTVIQTGNKEKFLTIWRRALIPPCILLCIEKGSDSTIHPSSTASPFIGRGCGVPTLLSF